MLWQRTLTALLLLAVLGAALFALPLSGWWLFCAVLASVAAWEWAGLLRLPQASRLSYASGVAVAVFSSCFISSPLVDGVLFGLSGVFWIMVVPTWLRDRWKLGQGFLGLALGLLVIVPTALAVARLRQYSPWFLLSVMAIAWVADICAYFGGRAFGRHKLAPTISPGKSWEGVWTGVLGVLLYASLVFALALPQIPARLSWPLSLVLVFALTALSVEGDLFESMLKRQADIKDSSNLLPGHGGVLDRIDSLTSTLPLVALWAQVWMV